MSCINCLRENELPKNREEAIDKCLLANRILAYEGIIDAFGHVSVRNPENQNTFFQSCAKAPEVVERDDIIEIDLDGNVVTQTDKRPYGERVIHSYIFKARPDVNAISHSHPHALIPFASTNVSVKTMAHFSSMFFEGVPVYDDYDVSTGMLIATKQEGERLARVLGDKRGCLMRNHGCVVVGETTEIMVMSSVYLRDNAVIQFQAMQMGEYKSLTWEEGREAAIKQLGAGPVSRGWGYWVHRVKKAMPDLANIKA